MQLNNNLTNLGVDSLDALSIVLLEELVSGQVTVGGASSVVGSTTGGGGGGAGSS
jgi:hypothetical protein